MAVCFQFKQWLIDPSMCLVIFFSIFTPPRSPRAMYDPESKMQGISFALTDVHMQASYAPLNPVMSLGSTGQSLQPPPYLPASGSASREGASQSPHTSSSLVCLSLDSAVKWILSPRKTLTASLGSWPWHVEKSDCFALP